VGITAGAGACHANAMREARARGPSTLAGSKFDVSEIDVAIASISSENLITASMILTEVRLLACVVSFVSANITPVTARVFIGR